MPKAARRPPRFFLYSRVQWRGSQRAGAGMVAEHVGVAHIALQDLHRLVPRYVTHFEHAGAAAGCARQEAGAQAVGAIIGDVEPELAGIAFGEVAYALSREPRFAHLAALASWTEDRPLTDPGGIEPRLDGLHRAGCAAADDGNRRALALLVGFRAPDRHPQAVVGELSIIGTDRSDNGYFRAKVAQEKLIETSGIPYTIIRSTPVLGIPRRHHRFKC